MSQSTSVHELPGDFELCDAPTSTSTMAKARRLPQFAPASSTTKSRLLTLPPEIRLQILHDLFQQPVLWPFPGVPISLSPRRAHQKSPLRLLTLCRQMYAEALPLFYSLNTLYLSTPAQLYAFLCDLSPERRRFIHGIVVGGYGDGWRGGQLAKQAFSMLGLCQSLKVLGVDLSIRVTPGHGKGVLKRLFAHGGEGWANIWNADALEDESTFYDNSRDGGGFEESSMMAMNQGTSSTYQGNSTANMQAVPLLEGAAVDETDGDIVQDENEATVNMAAAAAANWQAAAPPPAANPFNSYYVQVFPFVNHPNNHDFREAAICLRALRGLESVSIRWHGRNPDQKRFRRERFVLDQNEYLHLAWGLEWLVEVEEDWALELKKGWLRPKSVRYGNRNGDGNGPARHT